MNIEILGDSEAVAERAASMIVDFAWDAITARGTFVMAVSGGRTP
jgi:6-phosphogluconolactonase